MSMFACVVQPKSPTWALPQCTMRLPVGGGPGTLRAALAVPRARFKERGTEGAVPGPRCRKGPSDMASWPVPAQAWPVAGQALSTSTGLSAQVLARWPPGHRDFKACSNTRFLRAVGSWRATRSQASAPVVPRWWAR